jgi:hypothetical protein
LQDFLSFPFILLYLYHQIMKRALFSVVITLTTLIAALGQDTGDKERVYSVPDINGRATLLVQPEIPSDVSLKSDGNTLIVKIVVDANGNVVSAKCSMDCPKAATRPAEAAAMASKFRPLIIGGQAVKYDGSLMYSITIEKVNWYRFATALQSTYIFDNLSIGPVAAMLTNEFAGERTKLQELDRGVELDFRWKTIESVKGSIKGRLQGRDAWWFDLGFAMREVTSPFQSDKKLDLSEVQTAISNLTKFVESAPSDAPPLTIENLRTLATYKINPAMPPQEVRRAIFKLASGIRP